MSTDPRPDDRPALQALYIRIRDLFSSISFGVVLLVLLFLYSSVGSAGMIYPTSLNIFDGNTWAYAQIRQFRPFEMTEYEWFNAVPFNLLMLLICTTLVVTTIRRIPFRLINLGVWMIHTGIIILALGSYWYFTTKIEGDSPVTRRNVTIELPAGGTGILPAIPGARTVVVDGVSAWEFMVTSIDPTWSIRSGEDAGQLAYSVTVAVEGPGQSFMRQLLVGYPQYTEDIVRSDDPAQPMKRAVKEFGRPLVNEDLKLGLVYDPQEWVYLANWVKKSWALYIREAGELEWTQRPLDGMPFYNDYIGSYDEVWLADGEDLPLDPLDVVAYAVEEGDPLAGTPVKVTSYLRYAHEQTRQIPGGEMLNPAATLTVNDTVSGRVTFDLAAFDPETSTAADGALGMVWVRSAAERDAMTESRDSTLTLIVPGDEVHLEIPLTADMRMRPRDEFTPIEGTDFEYHVNYWTDNLVVQGRAVSMTSVNVRSPDISFERWVFEEQALTHDRPLEDDDATHGEPGHVHGDPHDTTQLPPDASVEMAYRSGHHPAPITLIAGPGENDLALMISNTEVEPELHELRVGQIMVLGEGTDISVTSYSARTRRETRPAIVPRSLRDRDVAESRSMVKVNINMGGVNHSAWVPYHQYPFRNGSENLRRYRYHPTSIRLADGRTIELVLSRKRVPLPAAVVLDDFELATHVGGFSGRTSSIRNWTSKVRFEEGDGWSDTLAVSVNDPIEHGGYWFFQAQWDPPMGSRFAGDPPSAGLNYTVLGVGNRNGVLVQLLGCTIAVTGMIYAFYFKPILRRRRRKAGPAVSVVGSVPAPTLEAMGKTT
jgi:hypothetical protein